MGSIQLSVSHSTGAHSGAAAGVAIPLGIRAGDVLLAVVSTPDAGGDAAGHDPAAFTVSNGSIQSATVNTEGRRVCAIWQPK